MKRTTDTLPSRCPLWDWRGGMAVLLGLALGGCASGPARLHTEVQAFGTASASTPQWQGARYRFDVLPSQAGLDLSHLHAMTKAALAAHGLVHDAAQARYAVQVSASVRTVWVHDGWGPSPDLHPWRGWGWGWGVGVGFGRGAGFWGTGHWPPTSTFWRELRLAILDGQTQQTVYETQARAENPSAAHDPIFAAMLKAALQEFPHSSAGWQRVTQELTPIEPPSAPAPAKASASAGEPATPADAQAPR